VRILSSSRRIGFGHQQRFVDILNDLFVQVKPDAALTQILLRCIALGKIFLSIYHAFPP
jgi:hypothetical protein